MMTHREASLTRNQAPKLRRDVQETGHEEEHERDPLRIAHPVLVLFARVTLRRQVLVLRVPIVQACHPTRLLRIVHLRMRANVIREEIKRLTRILLDLLGTTRQRIVFWANGGIISYHPKIYFMTQMNQP